MRLPFRVLRPRGGRPPPGAGVTQQPEQERQTDDDHFEPPQGAERNLRAQPKEDRGRGLARPRDEAEGEEQPVPVTVPDADQCRPEVEVQEGQEGGVESYAEGWRDALTDLYEILRKAEKGKRLPRPR